MKNFSRIDIFFVFLISSNAFAQINSGSPSCGPCLPEVEFTEYRIQPTLEPGNCEYGFIMNVIPSTDPLCLDPSYQIVSHEVSINGVSQNTGSGNSFIVTHVETNQLGSKPTEVCVNIMFQNSNGHICEMTKCFSFNCLGIVNSN